MVSKVLHFTVPLQFVAVKVAFSPSQHTVLLNVITGLVGNGLLVIVTTFDTNEVPHEVLQVAEYVPAPTSTVIEVELTPVHAIVPAQPVAVIVVFSVPHKAVFNGVNTGAFGIGLLVIVTVFEFADTPQIVVQVAV